MTESYQEQLERIVQSTAEARIARARAGENQDAPRTWHYDERGRLVGVTIDGEA